ncbi:MULTISPECIES: PD-(D/E)XK nuclease family protein [Pectobacterium]|uniref:PDDEXK-like family protein n=1 Tax=Pectobacterium TaxID=122277 RepID=UPI00047395CD|nr:PD-(D/E)XK nuclease family protein [Pectobacterium parmentieri]
MEEDDIDKAVERLFADEDLVTLCELQRTGDEVLDVISLSENQHSDILGWLLDPREGHTQGDQILQDLLIAASQKVTDGESGLDGRCTTAKFFSEWPPSRIRTSNFGSAFCARELGMKKEERVDLFVIDPQNKFILLIENKSRAAHSKKQLQGYRESFADMVQGNSHLRQYDCVYIALDRDFDGEDCAERPCSDAWLHLGYDWLKISANRALLHVERGNSAAKLVVSYCNRQTDWESPQTKRCIELASALHQKYPEAMLQLLKSPAGRIEKIWLKTKHPPNALIFALQNKSVLSILRETKGMASVKMELIRRVQSIPLSNIDHARAWLAICPVGWEQFSGERWPLYMLIRVSEHNQSKFSLKLVWNSDRVGDAFDAQNLRCRLAELEPKFLAFLESRHRRVPIANELSLTEIFKIVDELNSKLKSAKSMSVSIL